MLFIKQKIIPLRILFINIDAPYAFSQEIGKVMGDELGHTVYIAGCLQTIVNYLTSIGNPAETPVAYYSKMGNKFSLKTFIDFYKIKEADLDLIFVEQAMFYYKNDVDVPVIYYHRDLWTECFMTDADLLLYRFWNHRTAIQYVSRNVWWAMPHLQFRNAVNPVHYDFTKEKEFKGLNFIGTQKSLESYMIQDFVQRDYYKETYDIVEYCRKEGLAEIHDYQRMHFPEYKEILEKCESVLFVPGKNAYHSRRLYEAACAKAMLVIYTPDEFAKGIYNKLGLKHGYNCVMFDDIKKLKNIFILYKNKRKKIIERAYEWIENAHTFKIRAKQLEGVFERFLVNMATKKDKLEKTNEEIELVIE